jgi:hypothetical protein
MTKCRVAFTQDSELGWSETAGPSTALGDDKGEASNNLQGYLQGGRDRHFAQPLRMFTVMQNGITCDFQEDVPAGFAFTKTGMHCSSGAGSIGS